MSGRRLITRRLLILALVVVVAALSGRYVADLGVGGAGRSEKRSRGEGPSFLDAKGGFPLVQCYLAPDGVPAKHPISEDFQDAWLELNPTLRAEFFDSKRAVQFIARHYGAKSREMRQYNSHKWYTERADYFRILAVYAIGGLYIDNDVEPLRPVHEWLSTFGWGPEVGRNLLLVGVEMPRSRGGLSLQIVNFNFLASHPGHPALRRVMDVIERASETVKEGTDNVMIRTGPLAFSRGVLDWLGHEVDPAVTDQRGVLFARKDDTTGETWRVLLLPYRAFGNHPSHGNDVNKEPYSQHLVHHHFHGTWRPDMYRGRSHFKVVVEDRREGQGGRSHKFANWQEYSASMPKHPPMPRP